MDSNLSAIQEKSLGFDILNFGNELRRGYYFYTETFASINSFEHWHIQN